MTLCLQRKILSSRYCKSPQFSHTQNCNHPKIGINCHVSREMSPKAVDSANSAGPNQTLHLYHPKCLKRCVRANRIDTASPLNSWVGFM